jgi:hypothetical protein
MEPGVTDNAEQERFEIREDGELAGFTRYRRKGKEITFTHTETDRRFRGRGVAARLVSAALDEARRQGLEVIPSCPFVRSWIAENPGYADLVPAARRDEFGL